MKTLACGLVLGAVILITADTARAQWVQTNGPCGGAVSALTVSDTNLFAGTGGGVFCSTTNGASWNAVNSGLTDTNVRALAVSGTNLFAGTDGGGVFRSTNNGASWTAVNSGLTNTDVGALAVSGTNLFAGTDGGGVFLSTDNGAGWTAVNSGLTNTGVLAFAVSGTNLFAGTAGGGVFLSSNNGTSWTAVNSGLANTEIYTLAVSGTHLFAGTNGGGVWRRPLAEMITGVKSEPDELPAHFALEQNYPNPFNSSTVIGYRLHSQSRVRLSIFNPLGQEIAVLVSSEQQPAFYQIRWQPPSEIPSGIYFYRIEATSIDSKENSFIETRKLILLE